MRFSTFTIILFVFCSWTSAQETTVIALTTTQDVLISSQGSVEKLEYLSFGSEGDDANYRSILKFDLSDLPIGQLKHATLSLTMANDGNGIISIHKVMEDWQASNYDVSNYADWISTGIEDRKWNTIGGDYFSIPSGRAVFNNNETLDLFGPRMKLDIEQWAADPSSNNGWIVMGVENVNNSRSNFHSGKNLTQGPTLTLIYEVPNTCYANGGNASTIGDQTVIAKCRDQDIIHMDLKVNDSQGKNKIWLVCNSEEEILGFSIDNSIVVSTLAEQDFAIYHLCFNGEILGASIGSSIRNLVGCYSLSNKIEILGSGVSGGEITTTSQDTEVSICPNNIEDIYNLTVQNKIGTSSSWVVLDNKGFIKIIGTQKPSTIRDLPPGSYRIQHLSYQGDISGLILGENINDIAGCYDWSNVIDVTLLDIQDCRPPCSLEGSLIRGGELRICPDATIGTSFNIDSLEVGYNNGIYGIWILTDHRGNTLEALPDVSLSSYKVAEGEVVFLFYVTYSELTFLFRNNIYDLNGCYGISNGLRIRGIFTGGCPLICDLPEIEISTNELIDLCQMSTVEDLSIVSDGDDSFPAQFIIRNANDSIISMGDSTMPLELGENSFYNLTQVIAYEDSAFINFNKNLENENTCFSFSNSIDLVHATCPFECKSPESFNISESDVGNVTIKWERIEGATNYEFEIGFNTDTTDLTMLRTGRNWIQISNPSKRSLVFRVKSNCGEDGYSPYSEFISFESSSNTLANSRSTELEFMQNEFHISPNPASDRVYFEYNVQESDAIVEIYDATGRLKYKKGLDQGNDRHVIDISTLETGLHIIRVSSRYGIQGRERFIKIK